MTERTKSIVLLTAYFNGSQSKSVKPLSITEWNRLVIWMQKNTLNPEDLLLKENQNLLFEFKDKSIKIDRILALLERKFALAMALEEWSKLGIWIISRADAEYPKWVKKRLKLKAPPILFGIGDISLLENHYIGIVGSRHVDEQEKLTANQIGAALYNQKYGVVSGAARGVDESSMIGVLNEGGYAIAYVSDSLLKKASSLLYRDYIIKNQLCLLSACNPNAGFNAGNAMARNKLIYAHSQATIVIKSDVKGGTWNGAKENLTNKWVPLWVLDLPDKGNVELHKKGAHLLKLNSKIDVNKLINNDFDLFSASSIFVESEINQNEGVMTVAQDSATGINEKPAVVSEELAEYKVLNNLVMFDYFIQVWKRQFGDSCISKNELTDYFDVLKSQLEHWLKLGIEKKIVVKSKRPITYRLNNL